jgi:hypothetical protein
MRSVSFFFPFLALSAHAFSQNAPPTLKFTQGQTITIRLELESKVAQQAMSQAIDFEVKANAVHSFKVTNTTAENTTLHHELKSIRFSFDGMGHKRTFDSNNERDLSGQFGNPIKELLTKTYDIIIDSTGTVLLAQPEKFPNPSTDDRFAIISNMLKDIFDLVQPPSRSGPSFFKILPAGTLEIGKQWSDNYENANGQFENNYQVTAINDTAILLKLTGSSLTNSEAQVMGNDTRTIMKNITTGTINIDRSTGMIRNKFIVTESNGTTEMRGNSVPVTSKTTIAIKLQ